MTFSWVEGKLHEETGQGENELDQEKKSRRGQMHWNPELDELYPDKYGESPTS